MYRLAEAPIGFFADEAGIGLAAWDFLHGDWSLIYSFGFYRHLNEYYLGLLGPLSTMPFVFLFGLTDWAVRAASVTYGLITLFIWSKIMDKMGLRGKYGALFLIWSIPLFFHPMRTQFGLTVSLMYLSFALWILICSNKLSRVGAFGVGFLGVASGYGNNGFIVSGTVCVACMALGGYFTRFFQFKRQMIVLVCYFLIGCMFALFPFALALGREPLFLKRIIEKNASSGQALFSKEKILFDVGQYPRYFDLGYLLNRGEVDSQGSGNFRHTISGFGQFSYLQGGVIAFGLGCLAFVRRYRRFRYVLVATVALFLTYPLADIISQNGIRPPYTYSIYILVLPSALCIMYGVDALVYLAESKEKIKKYIIRLLIGAGLVYGLVYFGSYFHTYLTPTVNTAGFYGWQWGPREIVLYLTEHENEYDELYIQGVFNAGTVFIPFYDPHNICKDKCKLGGFEMYNTNKKQLFVLQSSSLKEYMAAIPWLREVNRLLNPADKEKTSYYFMTPR
ncbi:MAG: hypothetical protein WCO78_03760 [Candidatus Roizmanbacteria bacterium]